MLSHDDFDPRCWLLAGAPDSYPTQIGTVTRTRSGDKPGTAWFDGQAQDWLPVVWVEVANPKSMTREEWSAYVAERGLPDMPKRVSA